MKHKDSQMEDLQTEPSVTYCTIILCMTHSRDPENERNLQPIQIENIYKKKESKWSFRDEKYNYKIALNAFNILTCSGSSTTREVI